MPTFEQLPREIRDRIYYYAFCEADLFFCGASRIRLNRSLNGTEKVIELSAPKESPVERRNIAILCLNHAIYVEASQVLYNKRLILWVDGLIYSQAKKYVLPAVFARFRKVTIRVPGFMLAELPGSGDKHAMRLCEAYATALACATTRDASTACRRRIRFWQFGRAQFYGGPATTIANTMALLEPFREVGAEQTTFEPCTRLLEVYGPQLPVPSAKLAALEVFLAGLDVDMRAKAASLSKSGAATVERSTFARVISTS